MPLDMPLDIPFDQVPDPRTLRGLTSYNDGLAAEDIVSRDYLSRGYRLVAQRWRGRCGEIDLIFQGTGELIFVEVKKARSFDIAATRLSQKQLLRIAHSAEDYIGTVAENPLTPMRLDFAMVDDRGDISILENLTLY